MGTMEHLLRKNIVSLWFFWYFFEIPKEILRAWKNFLKFGLNYFSIFELLKTFFSPWKKYAWVYPRGFDLWTFFETLSSNLITRILGMILRSILITIGFLFEIFILFSGFLIFLGWLVLPIFLILGFYYGIRLSL